MTLIEKVREMIAEGETERSLKELYDYVKENNADVIDKLIMLRSRMQTLQNSLLTGTMNEQDASIERAKINEAILKLLPQLTPEYLAQASQAKAPEPLKAQPQKSTSQTGSGSTPSIKRSIPYLVGGAVLGIILLIIIFSGGDSSSSNENLAQQESTTGSTSQEQENTLLSNVLADGAIWVSNTGSPIFGFENAETCHEIEGDNILYTYNVIDNDNATEYIALHDPSRNIYLLVGKTTVQVQNGGEDTWSNLYTGEWVIPADEEQ
ncbi:MAG: hypothetical protein ACK4TA_14460 [Saprospiraceae bacterium]